MGIEEYMSINLKMIRKKSEELKKDLASIDLTLFKGESFFYI